ncbi:hypothetical protein J3R30DRAFT_3669821 [Lentinula aciculospora]|uniref:Ubiquitin-activating enzyme E1-like n=1 Tax=Lentinula aciculospora TaxID=153920 RepID=A0A9W9DPD1_9AGAR|nr:hypothetical protein J3R30DRAFT_3669821 [Lentinula aciculospora]
MSTASGRTAHAKAILGPELHSRLAETKVLLVGAGGIGCELLKNIVLTGFGHITLLDLDTIDLSNLNRQFLFRKKDVKKSKSIVAARVAGDFNPNIKIKPIFGNIKEEEYDLEWFKGFDLVLNALDNLDARRHVNKMCMAANVPLVESGTAGYLGQVQPLVKDLTECFDCIPKPTPKTFPVCTIRSTPSQPIHCIVWSKSYLMGQLFGIDEDAGEELDEAEKQGENAEEIANLRKEAQSFKKVRDAIRNLTLNSSPTESPAKQAFLKIFKHDIERLLGMSDMWKHRAPPVSLDYEKIMDGTFWVGENGEGGAQKNGNNTNGDLQPIASTSTSAAATTASARVALKDQKKLTLKENLELFISSVNALSLRLSSNPTQTIDFDKDDEDTLNFVTAASNLRSFAYGIEQKTKWEVKEMAGNIIPAIATTNAIISGLIVLQALHLLRKSFDAKAYTKLRNVHIQFKPSVPLSSIAYSKPNPGCGVCRDVYTSVRCDVKRTTLGDIVKGISGDREISVYEDKRVLVDPDWEDNYSRTLHSLNVGSGKFISIVDEEGEWETVSVGIGGLPNQPSTTLPFILPSPLPKLVKKTKAPAPSPSTPPPPRASLKRSLPDDNDGAILVDLLSENIQNNSSHPDGQPATKKPKLSTHGKLKPANPSSGFSELRSPSKKRRLEEDGLIMMEGLDDKFEEDVIVIDD